MLIEPIACLWRSVTATLGSTKKADASNARRPNITENKTPYTNKDNGDAIGGYALSPHLRPSGKCEAQRKVCFATNSTILRDALATRAFHVDGTIQEFLPQAVRHDTCAAHVTALPPAPPPTRTRARLVRRQVKNEAFVVSGVTLDDSTTPRVPR